MVKDFGQRIQALRKEKHLSQEALAEEIGVSRQAISKWECNEATPDMVNLSILAETLDVTVDQLINEEGSVNERPLQYIRLDLKRRSEILTVLSIVLYIASPFIREVLSYQDDMKNLIFGMMVAVATGMIIYANFIKRDFERLNKEVIKEGEKEEIKKNKEEISRQEALTGAVALIATAIFLYLGFVKDAWSYSWIVFLAIPMTHLLYDAFAKKKR